MIASVFERRVRGFRLVDLLALAFLLVLAFTVYGFKTFAGRESADINDVQHQIVTEQKRVRLLRAEIAHLEDPTRLARLSTQYLGLKPVPAQREATLEALPEIARPQVTPPVTAPTPAPAAKPTAEAPPL
jgi:cell division protein FtsL